MSCTIIRLDPAAVAAALKVHGSGLKPKDASARAQDKVVYTSSSFLPTRAGQTAMMDYMEICRGMFEQLHERPVVDDAGMVLPLKTALGSTPVSWEEFADALCLPVFFPVYIWNKRKNSTTKPAQLSYFSFNACNLRLGVQFPGSHIYKPQLAKRAPSFYTTSPGLQELKARTPKFFDLLIRGSVTGGAKQVTFEQYCHSVYCKFGAIAPKTSAIAWLQFLRQIDNLSPAALPQ